MSETKITAEPGIPQILFTREFNAPRELLFRAYTDPTLLVQWLGPRAMTMIVDHHDACDGGRWRFIHQDADANDAAFHGVYHGTPSVDGIIRTFEYEGMPNHVSFETLTFEERGNSTLVRTNAVFQSVEDRDAMVASGMEAGVNDSMERLDELLAKMAPVGERR